MYLVLKLQQQSLFEVVQKYKSLHKTNRNLQFDLNRF